MENEELNKKLKLVQQTDEEVARETERMNKSLREHPEALLAYLRKTGQLIEK